MQKSQEKRIHHAYLVEGYFDNLQEEIKSFVNNNLGFQIDQKDIREFNFKKFGVDDSRNINEIQYRRTDSDKVEVIIISIESITSQAQNALLKTLEEPSANKIFFLVSNINTNLLSTLKSRLEKLSFNTHQADEKKAKDFLSLNYKERAEYIKRFLADPKKDIPADKLGAIKLLDSVEIYLRKDLKSNQRNLSDLIKVKSYLKDTSSSVKNLLEYLCIFMPKS